MTVINRGLPEYELYADDARTLALTLLRCVGQLSGGAEAPGENDTPGAQCLGKYTFHYAFYPHTGSWKDARSWEQARSFNLPVRAIQADRHIGHLPASHSFITLEPSELVLSAVKKAEDSDTLVVRFYNTTDREIQGKIAIAGAKSLHLANLNEEIQKSLDRRRTFQVGPKKIVTVIAAF